MKCEICGMEINENNYNFNEHAFSNKNYIDNIIYCPCCGASKKYLNEENKIIEVDSNLLDEYTLKILDHAVKLEIFNGDFYNTAANMAESKEVSNLFKSLAKVEIFHSKVHSRLGGFDETPVLNKISYARYNSDNSLLELAKQKEEHAVAYYNKYKNEVKDKNIIRVFEALSEVEKEHIILVRN